ncbi:MAG: ribose 5-phosphate isomerase B [Myxococcales bacterium]|nr:ribose 5-phosphate isomerase B [Myxococcales bacterium]
MKWYAGSDHAGLVLKQHLIGVLRALGDEVVDLGTKDETSVDYPTYGGDVGRKVSGEPTTRGLVVCGSGIGISIAANKVAGVRCALVHDTFTAEVARLHNDANVIAFGQRVIGVGVAEAALTAFRRTEFEGGRHQRRVDQLSALDRS